MVDNHLLDNILQQIPEGSELQTIPAEWEALKIEALKYLNDFQNKMEHIKKGLALPA